MLKVNRFSETILFKLIKRLTVPVLGHSFSTYVIYNYIINDEISTLPTVKLNSMLHGALSSCNE